MPAKRAPAKETTAKSARKAAGTTPKAAAAAKKDEALAEVVELAAVPAVVPPAPAPVEETAAAAPTSDEVAPLSRTATIDMSDKKSEVVFSFDTTGSMYGVLAQVRTNIQDCVKRLFDEIGAVNLRIGITAHGDYCDAGATYVTKHLPLTNVKDDIVKFVETVGATGGGDAPECYELVLHEAQSFSWTPGWKHVLVMIGDELPHEASYSMNTKKLDWRKECDKLKEMDVQVHGVQALSKSHATKFYSEMASRTGGVHMPLDQFSAISDLVMAVCFREARPSVLEDFEREVQAGGRYNRSLQTAFDRMLGRDSDAGPQNLDAVPPGRFQIANVLTNMTAKSYLNSHKIKFGRTFYEFTKPEIIDDDSEIVLYDSRSGDMYTGPYARTLINAPKGMGKVKVLPREIEYVPFLACPATRKLIAGTRFLYELKD